MSKISYIRHKASSIPALFYFKTFIPIAILVIATIGVGMATAKATSKFNSDDKTSLFHLLIGDLAGKRDFHEVALGNYIAAAEKSSDPKMARIATEFAIQTQNIDLARKSASLWANIAPNEFRAALVAATLYVAVNEVKTKSYLITALELDSKSFYAEITGTYQMLTKSSQIKLAKILIELSSKYNKNEYLLLGTAYIVAQQDMIATAERLTNDALKIQASFSEAIELKAKIIRFKNKSDTPALEFLAKKIAKFPKDIRLKLFYSSALIDNNREEQAIKHLKTIVSNKEFGGRAAITIGKIYLDRKQYKNAKKYFKKLEKHPEFWSSGKYFLAQIAESEQKITRAINWYNQVYDGPFHVASFIRGALLYSLDNKHEAAINMLDNAQPTNLASHKKIILTKIEILIESGKYEQALNDANRVLEVIPTDIDLLYARSLIAGYLDNINLAEQDLSRILSLDPNHANALNALGFTLSHIPDRREDAMAYIERAMKIAPNNPNYMDSMGWLLFQMGKIDDAILILERAYKISPDIDIAIHYSKALWTKGNKEQAMAILNQALTVDPNNQVLKKALSSFQSNLK